VSSDFPISPLDFQHLSKVLSRPATFASADGRGCFWRGGHGAGGSVHGGTGGVAQNSPRFLGRR